MIHTFEREYDDKDIIDHNLEPISILCIDGGGLRGVWFCVKIFFCKMIIL